MTRSNAKRRELMIRPAIAGGVLAAMLVLGVPASAEEGGDPANHISIFERVKAAKAMPWGQDTKVVEAAAPATTTKRFHDKTEAEWRAYHAEMREVQRLNTGR